MMMNNLNVKAHVSGVISVKAVSKITRGSFPLEGALASLRDVCLFLCSDSRSHAHLSFLNVGFPDNGINRKTEM